MKIAQLYSHINGLEFLTVHHKKDYEEIKNLIKNIKSINELKKLENSGPNLIKAYSSTTLNKDFTVALNKKGWKEQRLDYIISCDPNIVNKIENLEIINQKALLKEQNTYFDQSFNKARFIKNKMSVDLHFKNNLTLTYNLFVKNISFFDRGLIDIAIEILPTKNMKQFMQATVPWFEKEVHNVLRHGRTNPPVPLLIIGIEP